MTATDYTPALKQVQPISFLFFRTETSLAGLAEFFHVAPELYAEASALKLPVTGPVHWHYLNFKDHTQPFTLEIALPVAGGSRGYDGKFHFKRTDHFKCLSIRHDGNWQEMGDSYGKLLQHASAHGLVPSGMNREIYINVDFVNPSANVTEIQLGVQ